MHQNVWGAEKTSDGAIVAFTGCHGPRPFFHSSLCRPIRVSPFNRAFMSWRCSDPNSVIFLNWVKYLDWEAKGWAETIATYQLSANGIVVLTSPSIRMGLATYTRFLLANSISISPQRIGTIWSQSCQSSLSELMLLRIFHTSANISWSLLPLFGHEVTPSSNPEPINNFLNRAWTA